MGEGRKVKKTTQHNEIEYDAHFLESIYEGAELPMFVLDVTPKNDFIFQGLNPAHERVSGMKSDKIKGRKPEELTELPPEARKAVKANYRRCLEAGKPIQYQEMIPMKGKEVHWLTTLTPLRDSSGGIYRIVGTAMYINELVETQRELEEHKSNLRKKVEEKTKELQESEERYRLANEATNQGIWDWDVQSNEVFFSKTWKKQIGYKENELPDEFDVWIEHLHPDDKDRCLGAVQEYLENPKGKFIIEFRFRHKKGHYIYIHNEAASKKDSKGNVIRMYGAHSDITKQKEAEDKLTASEAKYKTLTESSRDNIFIIDEEFRIAFANDTAAKAFGKKPSDLVGGDVKKIFPPDIAERQMEALKYIFRTGESISRISESEFPHGKVWLETDLIPLKNENGKIESVMGVSRDVTENIKRQKEIENKTLEYQNTLDDAPALIWKSGADAKCYWFNKEWLRWTGRTMEQEVGDGWAEGVHKDDFDKCLDIYLTAFKTRQPFEMEYRLRKANGNYGWILDIGKPSYDVDGEFVGYIGYCFDIDDRIKKEELIEASEEKHRAIFEAVTDALIIADYDEMKIAEVNPAACKLYGYKKSELIGMNAAQLVHPDSHYKFSEFIGSIQKTGSYKGETTDVRKDGSTFQTEVRGANINFEGKPHLLAVIRDVSEKKKTEEELRKNEDMLKQAQSIAKIGSWELDITNDQLHWSDEIYRMFGLEPQEFEATYEGFLNNIHPDDRDKVNEAYTNSLKTKEPYEIVHRLLLKDGSLKYVLEKCDTYFDDEGHPIRSVGIVQDITEMKIAQDEVLKEKEFTDSVINAMPGIFYLFDQDGKFIKWNDTLAEFSGFSSDEIADKSPLDFIAPHHHEKIKKAIQTAFTMGEVFVEADFLAKGRDNIPFYFTGIRIIIDDKPLLLGVGIDISRRKLAEEQREEALRDLNERMKEITCIYSINELFRDNNSSLKNIFQQVVNLIPPGWQFPENTCAKIEFDEIEVRSDNYVEVEKGLFEKIIVDDQERGMIQISLFGLEGLNGFYLKEEVKLIKEIAFSISQFIQRFEYEIALKESEEHFRTILQGSPLPKAITDMDGNIEFLNNSFVEILGYSVNDIPTLEKWNIFAYPESEYRESINAIWDKVMQKAFEQNTASEPIEAKIKCKDGEVRIFTVIGSRIGDKVIIVFNDLTDRVKAEERFINLFNNSPVSIWEEDWTDVIKMIRKLRNEKIDDYEKWFNENMDFVNEALTKVKILRINKETQLMFNAKGKDDLVKSLEVVFATEDTLPGFVGELVALTEGKTVYETEMKLNTVDGKTIETLLRMTFPSKSDESGQVLVSIMDISELKKAESQLKTLLDDLKRSNEELEQFAYVASHDLQEPLRMVSSYTQLLERRYKESLDDDAKDFIHYAVDGANRMQILINDLLQYSRVTTRGKDFEKTDLNEILGNAIVNLKSKIDETGTIITNNELPVLNVDASQILRVFQNLITNGMKYRKNETPSIHIGAVEKAEEFEFTVRDNGIGIDSKFHKRIFEIFERLHTKDEYEGTGIGLAICKRIIERHGGKIWVESEIGEGSIFHFTLNKIYKEN